MGWVNKTIIQVYDINHPYALKLCLVSIPVTFVHRSKWKWILLVLNDSCVRWFSFKWLISPDDVNRNSTKTMHIFTFPKHNFNPRFLSPEMIRIILDWMHDDSFRARSEACDYYSEFHHLTYSVDVNGELQKFCFASWINFITRKYDVKTVCFEMAAGKTWYLI